MDRSYSRTTALIAAIACIALTPTLTAAQTAKRPAPPAFCSGGICESEPKPVATGGIKWHPGHYMSVGNADVDSVSPSVAAAQSRRFGYYEQIADSTTIEGVALILPWTVLEGAKHGDYSAGISLLRAELAKLESLSVPKRLFLRLKDTGPTKVFPAYFVSAGCTAPRLTGSQTYTEWLKWNERCLGYYEDLLDAYSWLDDEPYFEGLYLVKESALGGNQLPEEAGFTRAGYFAGLKAIAEIGKRTFPKSNVVLPVNHFGGATSTNELVKYLPPNGLGWGNPDTCPDCGMDGDNVILGKIGGRDYRGELPLLITVEASELGYDSVGRDGGYTPAELFRYANGTLRVSHMMWHRNEYTGTREQRWSTGILPFIDANPLKHTACPGIYSSCRTD